MSCVIWGGGNLTDGVRIEDELLTDGAQVFLAQLVSIVQVQAPRRGRGLEHGEELRCRWPLVWL